MTQNTEKDQPCKQRDDTQRRENKRVITVVLDDLDDVDKAMRDAFDKSKGLATSVGESIRDTIKSVKSTRDNVVMLRIDSESLEKIDELVESGVTSSRSAAAAFLVEEGIKARSDLFDKIAEETEVIRKAKERIRSLLEGGSE
ncbi:MAG: hypothetical protein OXC95_14735 [Dehalococcoidia bacterium]|nr:hypothetical protein [Dehalococcoidia bacterium]